MPRVDGQWFFHPRAFFVQDWGASHKPPAVGENGYKGDVDGGGEDEEGQGPLDDSYAHVDSRKAHEDDDGVVDEVTDGMQVRTTEKDKGARPDHPLPLPV